MSKKSLWFYGSLIVLECALWGLGNPLIKLGLEVITPFYCLAIRFIMASALLMIFSGRRIVREMRREFLLPTIVVGIFTAIAFTCSVVCMLYTSATVAGFLMGTSVLFTPFFAYFIVGAKFYKKHFIPILIVLVGLYFLCMGGDGRFSFGFGEFLAITSAVSSACMLSYSSKYLDRIPNMIVTVMQCAITGVLCLIAALLFEDFPGFGNIPAFGWMVIIYLAIGCSIIAYICQNAALSHVPATYVALIFCSEPLFTAVFSNWMLGETLSGAGFLGASLIMASIVIASLMPVGPRPIPKPGEPIRADKQLRHAKEAGKP